LRIWHEQLWVETRLGRVDHGEGAWEQILTEPRELTEAVRTLAAGELISSALLADLLLALTEYESICRELYDGPWADESRCRDTPPGYIVWRHLVDLSTGAVAPSQELSRLCQLGTAVGISQYQTWDQSQTWDPDLDLDFIPPAVAAVPGLLEGLGAAARTMVVRAGRAAVREITKPAAERTFQACERRLEERRSIIARLDRCLRSALRGRAAQEPLLVLDAQTITFFGSTRPLTAFTKSLMGCLRVLAEQTLKPVARETIRREGRIPTDDHNLKWIVHRLDKALKAWARESSALRDGDRPPGVSAGFIKGFRAPRYEKKGKGGPFMLNLDPARVLVRGPRPDWMKPAPNP
jgi:hypothetical protein